MTQAFDVFLSYNREDQQQVASLNKFLKDELGLKPWFDEDQILPGESFVTRIEDGIRQSRTCAVFVGRKGLGPWENKEFSAVLALQAGNRDFRIIPVLLASAPRKPDLPLFLRDTSWVDLRTDFIAGIRGLLAGIRGTHTSSFTRIPLVYRVGRQSFSQGLPGGFNVDIERIVSLLIGESLYSRRDVFVREIIQNAFDACERRRGVAMNYAPEIVVRIDDQQGWFEVDDNGEGMDPDQLRERFAVIGKSIHDQDDIKSRILDDDERLLLIARFGIGFITAFIASNNVGISTRHESSEQINFTIQDFKSAFRYTPHSNCKRDPRRTGTTVRLYLSADFQKGGEHYIDLLDATKRYVRHVNYVKLFHNNRPVKIPEDWNIANCMFTQPKRVPRQFELYLGIGKADGRILASNGGFYITENLESILPYYTPRWIVGEISLWPGKVDLNLARDGIVENSLAAEFKEQLRKNLRDFLLAYIRDCIRKDSPDDRSRDLLLLYLHAYINLPVAPDPPLLTFEETSELLLDLVRFPLGAGEKDISLRRMIDNLKRRGKNKAYAYWNSSSHPALSRIISRLEAQGNLVFEYQQVSVQIVGRAGEPLEVYERDILGGILAENEIELIEMDHLPSELMEDLTGSVQNLPAVIRNYLQELQLLQEVFLVKIPEGDFAMKIRNTTYLNIGNSEFQNFIDAAERLPENVIRSYLLGLMQLGLEHL